MRYLLYIAAAITLMLGSCAEKKSPLDAEARDSGMRAAAALVAVDHTDTMSMERAVMDAKAKQSVYALKRDSAAVRAFDEAFRSYLKEKDRPLYNSIFPEDKK
ncbi:MAG: hypothetical protein IJK41_11970 [Muribaculaceae bacterium]|nr:hypothetical protein [Muribaculaceae bacterium]